MKMHRLISSNQSAVESYLAYTNDKASAHKIVPKFSSLLADWDTLSSAEREQFLNKIDDQLFQIFTTAETKCRKLRTGQIYFSLELSDLGLRWQFLRKVLLYRQRRFKDRNFLHQTAKKLNISSFSLPTDVILSNLRDANQNYLRLNRHHHSARDRYMSSVTDQEAHLRKLRSKEKLKLKWKNIRNTLAKEE